MKIKTTIKNNQHKQKSQVGLPTITMHIHTISIKTLSIYWIWIILGGNIFMQPSDSDIQHMVSEVWSSLQSATALHTIV